MTAMFLYFWDNVMEDYNFGMMCAIASSPEEARAMLAREYGGLLTADDLAKEPQVIPLDKPWCFARYGGS